MALEPLTQIFTADAAGFLGAIDDMIAACDRLTESITATTEAAARLSEIGGEATAGMADADDAAAASADRLTEATDAAGDAADTAEGPFTAVAEAIARQGEAVDELTGSYDELIATVDEATAANERLAGTADETTASTDASDTSVGLLGSHGKLAFLALAAGVAVAIHAAGDFQQSMVRLVTSAGESQKNLSMVSQGILAMSSATNTSTTQLAQGMYYVESAGYHGAAGLTVLKAAAEGAQAEGAQLATVSNAITSTLNAYNLKASDSVKITDEMVTAVGRGKMTMQDLSGSLAAVLPTAAAAHVSFSQVAGAIATMTGQGQSAEESAQLLRHTMQSLENPNNVQIQEMQQLGVNSNELAKNIGKNGLTGTINDLEVAVMKSMGKSGMVMLKSFNQSKLAAKSAQEEIAAMPPALQKTAQAYLAGSITAKQWNQMMYEGSESAKSKNLLEQFATTANAANGFNAALKSGNGDAQTFTAAMSKVMGGTEGLQVALMVGGKHAATFNDNVKAIAGSAEHTGANVKNWSLITHNFNFALGSAVKAVEAMGISFGTALLPAATAAVHVIGDVTGWIAHCAEASKILALIIGGTLAVIIGSKLMSALSSAGSAVGGLMRGFGQLAGMLPGVTTGTEAAAGAQTELDTAMDANPIGAVVLAIAALALGMYELYKHCSVVRDALDEVGKLFKSAWTAAVHAAGAVISWFVSGPLEFIKQELGVFEKFWQQNGAEIEQIVKIAWGLISGVIIADWDLVSGYVKAAFDVFAGFWKAGWAIISGTVKMVWDLIAIIVSTAIHMVLDVISIVLDLISGKWGAAWDNLKALASTALHGCISIIKTIASGFGNMLYSAGKDIVEGLINGVKSMIGSVGHVMSDIGHTALSAVKGILGISSPSKEMIEIGKEITAGLVNGLEKTQSDVKSSCEHLADIVKTAFADKIIKSGTYSQLTDFIQRDNVRLQALATEREKIIKKIDAAKAYASALRSTTESSAALSGLSAVTTAQQGGGLYSSDIEAGLKASLTQIRQFSAALKKLTKLGLDKNLLNQLAQMGPAQGLQVAQALLDGPVSVIKSMDSTQTAINTASKNLARSTADTMYDSGKDAGKGFLSGLKGQESAIEKEMKKIADVMVKTIRHELGISSPSKVGIYHGQMFVEGIAMGMDEGESRVAASAKRVAAVMAGSGRSGAGEGSAAGGGGTQIGPIHVSVNGFVGNNHELATQIYDLLQAEALKHEHRNANNGLSLAAGRS